MIFDAVSSFASWSKLVGTRDDDFIDRLNHIYTVIILIIFSMVVTGGTYIGKAISCWIPVEAKGREDYVETVCWTGQTYHVSHQDSLHDGKKAVIHYYLWVPIILLFQASMFKIPNILWHMSNRGSGMNLDKISTLSEKTQMESESDRNETIEHIGNYINRWIMANQRRSKNILSRFRPRRGAYMTTIFFLMKLLYCVNAISQFFILGLLLKIDFAKYGLKVSSYARSDTVMMDEYIFPRTVYCDFQIRQLKNNPILTTQCVLPINVLNEKVFIFLWFWLCLVSTLSIINLIQWIYRILSKRSYVSYIFRYINIHEQSLTKTDKKSCRQFANDYLNSDVIMLLRVVGKNSTDLVVADLLGYLWRTYKQKFPDNAEKILPV